MVYLDQSRACDEGKCGECPGYVSVIDQDGNVDEEKLLAAQSCPTSAIEVYDTKTGTKIWPK